MRKRGAIVILILLVLAIPAMADNPSELVYQEFSRGISSIGSKLKVYAERLFWSLTTISVVWTGITVMFRKGDISDFLGELVKLIIRTGFFFWLLQNSTGMSTSILNSMAQMAQAAGAGNGTPNGIVSGGSDIIEVILTFASQKMAQISISSPALSLFWVVVAIIGALVAAYVSVAITIVACTAQALVFMGIFVLGFGGSSWTSEIAINYYKTLLATGLKMFAMAVLTKIAANILRTQMVGNSDDVQAALLSITLLIMIALMMGQLPQIIGNLVSHNSIGAPGSAIGTIAGVANLGAQAGMAVATGGSSMAATGTLSAVRAAAMRVADSMK